MPAKGATEIIGNNAIILKVSLECVALVDIMTNIGLEATLRFSATRKLTVIVAVFVSGLAVASIKV